MSATLLDREPPRAATTTATLRVLHGTPSWLPLTQTWMFTQLQHLPKSSIESHVVCGTVEQLEQFPVEHLHSLASSPWRWRVDRLVRASGLRRELGHLRRVARDVDAAVLHSHFGHIGWQNVRAARRAGLAHVVTFYGQDATMLPRDADSVWRARYRELFAGVDRVLAEGTHLAEVITDLGCPPHKVLVHHLGVELDRFEYRARTWRPGRPLRVLLAGTFTEKKGLPYAIEALARMRDEVDIEVTLIGDATDCEKRRLERTRIDATIAAAGLTVRRLGFQPHAVLLDEAYRHDVFLSPSVTATDGDSEGGAPVTILEMAATGLPVVSTRHCDIPEVLGPDGADLLATERDVDGLVARLRMLLLDAENWQARTRAVRTHLEREYDAKTQGERLATIYADAAAQSSTK